MTNGRERTTIRLMNAAHTIYALATAPLPAGVAVIRISGTRAWAAAEQLCPSFKGAKSRYAHYGTLQNLQGETLDKGLLIGFKNPQSFTGEDVVEIHCHGGRAGIQALLDTLLQIEGLRHAEAGEFTRRAFENGKLDLAQAEGLADLIHAETTEQHKQALRQLDGELGTQFETWRTQTLHLLAHVEAAIDFPDEELDVLKDAGLKEGLKALLSALNNALSTDVGERLREGFRVAILGRPNAGKSTLTNLLSGKETAIVSPIAGTTRDVVEAHLNIGGFPLILADTAGLRDTNDTIEKEGVKRAKHQASQADVILIITEAKHWPNIDEAATKHLKKNAGILVISKADKQSVHVANMHTIGNTPYPVLSLDLTDPQSLPPLLEALETCIRTKFEHARTAAMLTRQRHRTATQQAIQHLERAQTLYLNPPKDTSLSDMLAQDLRNAAACIGAITGRTDNEDVLDVVFSTFCVGK